MSVEQGSAGKRYELGVLFVHGIGDQKEGETLTAFGEPLIAWIRDWIAGHGQLAFSEPIRPAQLEYLVSQGLKPDGIEVTHAALFPSKRLSTEPAHSVLELRIKHAGAGLTQQQQRWLFAESWWGEQVQPPSAFKLLLWLFSRGPFVAFAHTAERAWRFAHPDDTQSRNLMRKLDATGWRHLVWPVALGRFFLGASVLQFCLLIAWIIALIPLPVVRKYVVAALQYGTRILGDSYGLVANDTQRGAILTRFRHTVDWLQTQCDKLVIVAHSQGAGVVHAALQERVVAAPALLITFGAGLVKLSQLRLCEVHRRVRLVASGWIVPTAWIALLLLVWRGLGSGDNVAGLSLLIGTFAIASLFCATAAWYAWHDTRTQPVAPNDTRFDSQSRWLDLYASADPVPQEALTTHLPDRGIVSERIINRRSALSDHNSYWSNKTEFVSRVVAELDREAGALLKIPDLHSSAPYRQAIKHYRDSIFYLSTAWWLVLLSVLGIAASRFTELAALGERFFAMLQGGPLDTTRVYIKAPGLLITWITQQLTGRVPEFYPRLGYASVVVFGALLIAYVCWTAIAALLKRWANALLDDFVGYPGKENWGQYGALLVWPFILLVAMLPPLFAYAVYQGLNPLVEIIRWGAVPVAAVIAVFILVALWQNIPKNAKALRRASRKLWLKVLKAIRPGSDHPASTRRGWKSWERLWQTVVVIWIVPVFIALIVGAGKRSGSEDLFGMALYFVLTPLLLARLFRLVVQRGRATWEAAAVVFVPLAVAAIGTNLIPAQDFQFSKWLLMFVLLSLLVAAVVYCLFERWVPPRAKIKIV